jgi:hypothetical protein
LALVVKDDCAARESGVAGRTETVSRDRTGGESRRAVWEALPKCKARPKASSAGYFTGRRSRSAPIYTQRHHTGQ